MSFFLAIALALVVGYLVVRRYRDQADRNKRDFLPRSYEAPRYYTLGPDQKVDFSARWPGWDGWYFFVIPDKRDLPLKMIRGSLMTGLYGLEGIDNYEKVAFRLSTSQAAEYLSLIPTLRTVGAGKLKENYLSHHYLPRETDLRMKTETLEVSVLGASVVADETKESYGWIEGAWPEYQMNLINPEADIRITLQCRAEHLIWWADFPGIFTYFAAFGKFSGEIVYNGGTHSDDPHRLPHEKETYPISGMGCFEHGFARKLFNFDKLRLPLAAVQGLFPSFKPIRYHYELFIDDQGHHGGFMKASAFRIDFRNRGGIYRNGQYTEIRSVEVEYLEEPAPDVVDLCFGQALDVGPIPAKFYRKWKVIASTGDGILEYTATREWPPASVGRNMIFYHFSYEGALQGRRISGRGYGEYVHL